MDVMCTDYNELFASGRAKSAANELAAVNFIQVRNVVPYDKHIDTAMIVTACVIAEHGSFKCIHQMVLVCTPVR